MFFSICQYTIILFYFIIPQNSLSIKTWDNFAKKRTKMMLRNRNLNVQEDGQPAAAGEPPKAGAGGAPKPNGGGVSRRRQAPASNCGEEEEKLANAVGEQQMGEGPKPKKTCPNGTTTSEDGDEQSSSSSSIDSTTIGQHQNLQQITHHATNTSNSPIIQVL
jgi:hypothetical protein